MTQDDIKKIREFLEFLVKQKISERINKLLSSERKVYDMSGVKGLSVKIIAKKTGLSVGKISGLWQKWESEGFLIKDGKSYRKVV